MSHKNNLQIIPPPEGDEDEYCSLKYSKETLEKLERILKALGNGENWKKI